MYYTEQREYIHEFDSLHKLLTGSNAKWDSKNMCFKFEPFSQVISNLTLDDEERDFLEQSARLRNFIQHNQTKKNAGGAVPTSEFIQRLRGVNLKFSQNAINYASQPVFYTQLGENVSHLLGVMSKNHYTSVPVMDKGVLIGIFSHHSFACYATNNLNKTFRSDLIKDMLVSPHGDGCEVYLYEAVHSKFVDIYKLYHKRIRLAGVFLTQTGNPHESIEAIITPWDLNFKPKK